jgi:two-component system NtrC family sensor kinase
MPGMTKADLAAENEALRQSLSREVAKRERLKRSSTAKIRQLTHSVNETLEQQTATSEILRVISQSPTNVTPVFQVIVEHARRLCDGVFANVVRLDGGLMHNMAHHGFSPEAEVLLCQRFPMPPSQGMSGRAILARAVVHAEDASSDAELGMSHDLAQLEGFRSMVSVPMVQGGIPLGAITVARRRAGRFPERQVQMLQTFADQAVIAIENVRLFNETKEALDQQTATSEILRVISTSPTDEQPVFDAIVRSARRLCDAAFSVVVLTETGRQALAAVDGVDSARVTAMQQIYPRPIARDTTSGRAILDRRVVHVEDSHADSEYTHPLRDTAELRSILTVPIFRESLPIGAVSVWRSEVRPFTDRQVELLQTFADQAVIAIENVRLFKELEARNRDLTESLEQQTATNEVLRVISGSPTDVQPVFDSVAESAARQILGRLPAAHQLHEPAPELS